MKTINTDILKLIIKDMNVRIIEGYVNMVVLRESISEKNTLYKQYKLEALEDDIQIAYVFREELIDILHNLEDISCED